MTDTGTQVVTETAPPSTEAAPVSTQAAPASTEQQAPETFSREYVEGLRQEAAGYRTRAKEYDDVFGAYDDDSRATLLDITRKLADPNTRPEAAERMEKIAAKIREAHGQGKVTRPDGEEDPDARPLTRKEFEELQAQRDEERQRELAIQSLENDARQLGYEPGTGEYFFFLDKLQLPDVAGDVQKAHEKVEQFFADKAAQRAQAVQDKAGKWPGQPGTAPNTGGAGNEVEPPKTWKEARARAAASLTRNKLTGS